MVSRKKRGLKLRVCVVPLNFAEDIKLLNAMDIAEKVLVGRVRGRHYSVEKL